MTGEVNPKRIEQRININVNDVCRFSGGHVVDVLKEQFYLVLNQFVYVGDVLGDTS